MSLLISQALIKPASRGRILPRNLVGLSICFSKIGSCESALLDLFGETIVDDLASAGEGSGKVAVGEKAGDGVVSQKDASGKVRYELEDLVDVMRSFNRLGHVHEGLCSAVNTQLHLAVEGLTKGRKKVSVAAKQQQQQSQHVQQQQQRQQEKLQDTIIDAAQELAAARRLRPEVAGALAVALGDQLETLKPRKLTMLLLAMSSQGVLRQPEVREFYQKVPGWLQKALDGEGRQELGQMSLAGLPVAVAGAIDQGVIAGSGPQLVVQLLERLEPLVGGLSREQVLGLMKACRTVGGEQGEQMQQQLKAVAGQRGWVE
jgi:hypothetical protein